MDLSDYRASSAEQQRTADLLSLTPETGGHALDIGARDGHFSRLLAERFESVTALDLEQPQIDHPRIECVAGNSAALPFADDSFDFVFCAEVLEHIPSDILSRACAEIERVAGERILIGVPYRQDIRFGRTTCAACGRPNPPWGHVNAFDEQRLKRLFGCCEIEAVSFVGARKERTNALSVALMDFARNPYGTYEQDEPCVHCGAALQPPSTRNAIQRIATKLGFWTRSVTMAFERPSANWMHLVLRKRKPAGAS